MSRPVEYLDFLLNNREVQVPSFSAVACRCEGVFEALNMITRLLLNKFINEGARKGHLIYAGPPAAH
jgi:mutual gliding-motility protein MglA